MKNYFILLCVLFSLNAFAKDFKIANGQAEYTVKHLVKTVKGLSREIKGKLSCPEKGECDFLVAIPVKSFISSDSNRDLNMQTILEVTKYPLVTVRGKILESSFFKDKTSLNLIVNFHGVEKEYSVNLSGGKNQKGQLTVLLEQHHIERPSLLTVKIENEVPIDFQIDWTE